MNVTQHMAAISAFVAVSSALACGTGPLPGTEVDGTVRARVAGTQAANADATTDAMLQPTPAVSQAPSVATAQSTVSVARPTPDSALVVGISAREIAVATATAIAAHIAATRSAEVTATRVSLTRTVIAQVTADARQKARPTLGPTATPTSRRPAPTASPTSTVTPTPSTATPTPTVVGGGTPLPPTDTSPEVDRKVIVLQGLNSEASCGSGLDDRVATVRNMVQFASSDVLGFSYAGLYRDCELPEGQRRVYTTDDHPGGPVTAIYDKIHTCAGVASAADRLRSMLLRLIQLNPDIQFDLVGHSMGGLAATYLVAIDRALADNHIRSITTLDSPLQGIGLEARLALTLRFCDENSQAFADLLPGSEIVETISRIGANGAAPWPKILSISTSQVGDTLPGYSAIEIECFNPYSFNSGQEKHSCGWNSPSALQAIKSAVRTETPETLGQSPPTVLSMQWLDHTGRAVSTLPTNSVVTLQAITRGYADGRQAIQIWESDPGGIAHADTLQMEFVDDVGNAEWTTVYAHGGLFDGGVEYFFIVQGFAYRSPELYVPCDRRLCL